MRVLITGARGFLGGPVVKAFRARGHSVIGCDVGMHNAATVGAGWPAEFAADQHLDRDFRTLDARALSGVACVVHLAGLANEPAAAARPADVQSLNIDGAVALAAAARQAGVRRFLFASSCALYESSIGGADVIAYENSPIAPKSAYAQSKLAAEQTLARLRGDGFDVLSLRLASAYGLAPSMRLDLAVNAMVCAALADGRICVIGDPLRARPMIHVDWIAHAMAELATLDRVPADRQTINLGLPGHNFSLLEIAATVRDAVAGATLAFEPVATSGAGNYRVSFDRLAGLVPSMRTAPSFAQSVQDLVAAYCARGIADFIAERGRFVRHQTTVNYFAPEAPSRATA